LGPEETGRSVFLGAGFVAVWLRACGCWGCGGGVSRAGPVSVIPALVSAQGGVMGWLGGGLGWLAVCCLWIA